MTDKVRMVGNVFRGDTRHVAPVGGMIIKDNVIRNSNDARDPADAEVDPSAGEDQAE